MVVLGAAMSAGTALAQVPSIVSYQGVDPSNPNATIPVKTTLYDAASGGSVVWTETQNATTDNTGMFSILMGSTGTATPGPLSGLNWNKERSCISIVNRITNQRCFDIMNWQNR